MLYQILSTGKTWIIVLLGTLLALIPDILYVCVRSIFFPTPTEKVITYLRRNTKVNSENDLIR